MTAFLGIGIESCLLCKGTPSHSHLCPADDYISKKPKAKLHFFFKYLWLKRLKNPILWLKQIKKLQKYIASVLMKLYSIAFIAFAVLEKMLVQMYNWSLCIQHMIKCTFVFKGNLCTLIKVTQFRIQLTVCECCLLVENMYFHVSSIYRIHRPSTTHLFILYFRFTLWTT